MKEAIEARARERHTRALYGGVSKEEWVSFMDMDRERAMSGEYPLLESLGFSNRIYHRLVQAGIWTAQGLDEYLKSGRKPYGLGPKSLPEVRQRLQDYQQSSTAE